MEKETIIMRHINIWNWHILGIIFLVGSFLAFLFESFGGNILWAVFLFCFLVCEIISINRRIRLLKEENHGD